MLPAVRLGDPSAKAAMLRAFQDVWFRFCLALVEDPDLARDATQETALRFLERLDDFAGRSTLQTWSLGIALNVCREMRRKTVALRGGTKGAPVSGRTLAEETPCPRPGAEATAANREEVVRLRVLIASLPPRQREAVALRYFEDLSVADAAKTMGCADGTVKATLAQALASLRRRWENSR